MTAVPGQAVAYEDYRRHHARRDMQAVLWQWAAMRRTLAAADHGERGSLTLSLHNGADGCEVIPGHAITVQRVPPGGSTRSHAHAWWHLFFVQHGRGRAILGTPEEGLALRRGDLLLVPAWQQHAFSNTSNEELILYSMSNLPQQAQLFNHRADEADGAAPALQTSRRPE